MKCLINLPYALTSFFKKVSVFCFFLFFVTGTGCSQEPLENQYKNNKISDLALIYQGGVNRLDWTADQFLPYVVHEYQDGHKDWLFDGFLFLEFADGKGYCYATGYTKKNARKVEWTWLLDRIFEKNKSLSALDQCIQSQKEEIGAPNFKHQIVLGLPMPHPGQTDWGELNGKVMDFSNRQDQLDVIYWYISELMIRFKEASYKNLELAGFYWVEEDVISSKDITIPLSAHIHAQKKQLYWIPYWKARGSDNWKELGFDIAYQQPNHFFNASIPDKRLDEACKFAVEHNMGMEMEFDQRALYESKDSFYNRFVAYLDYFEKWDVFRKSAIAYYSGGSAILSMYKSDNIKDKEVMDRLAGLIAKRHKYVIK